MQDPGVAAETGGASLVTSSTFRRPFKVVLVGEVNAGKTSLFQRVRVGRFQEWGSTVGVDQYSKEFEVDGSTVTLQLWDTAGSEKYRTLTANYYHSAAACVYLYDLGAADSLYNLSTWADDARRFEPRHCMFLVGNKCDLRADDIALEESTIRTFNEEMQFKSCWRISAKSGENVDLLFKHIAETLLARAGGVPQRDDTGIHTLSGVQMAPESGRKCSC